MKAFWGFLISVAILGAIIWIADPAETLGIIKKVDFKWFAIGIGLWMMSVLARSGRWLYFLKQIGMKIPLKDAISIYVIGMSISNVTPARAGDPIRSVILKKKFGYSFSKSITSIIIEKLGTAFSLVIMTAMGLVALNIGEYKIWLIATASIFLGLASWAIWIATSRKRAYNLLNKTLNYFSFIKYVEKRTKRASKKMKNLSDAFNTYDRKDVLIISTIWSLAIAFIDGALIWISFKAIGIDVPLLLTALSVPIIIAIGVISLLPGSIGSTEAATVIFFVTLAGVTTAQATAATLISRVIMWWMYMFAAGLVFMTSYRLHEMMSWIKARHRK